MADNAQRPTLDGFTDLALAKTTPRPWRTGSLTRQCLKPHRPHPGPPQCEYLPTHWLDDQAYFGRFVSAQDGTEIIGSDEHGPVLSLDDARLIVAAVNAYAPSTVGRAGADAEARDPQGASGP